jgi:uncharacterized peroxidase-related enzyme
MPRVEPLERENLTELEPILQMAEAGMGFVPTSMLTMARQPELMKSFAVMAGTILGPGRLDRSLKQLVAYVSSYASGCLYCQAHTAHGAFHNDVPAEKLENAFLYEESQHFTPAERAALRVAQHAGLTPNAVEDEHFEALREYYDDEEIVELVSVISLFGFLNRWNDTMATQLEELPRGFAESTLGAGGWRPGKHA